MGFFIFLVAGAVFFFMFRGMKVKAAATKSQHQNRAATDRESAFNTGSPNSRGQNDSTSPSTTTNARADVDLESEVQPRSASVDANKSFEDTSMLGRAETHVAENSILGGIVSPSPVELEKQVDYARPIMQPLTNSTSLFDADKVDDLTRPWGEQVASEPTNLFELDKKHDLTKPWGET